jgi:hypothetical protein
MAALSALKEPLWSSLIILKSSYIEEAFLYPGAEHTLITFKGIRRNGYYVATACEGKTKFLYITWLDGNETKVVEKHLELPLEYTIQQSKLLKSML